ncbi:MAG TPA: tyrosine--tRNA ligase [Firmicutes bacterium]|nr:tyrosine--tRNA ligase [Bacillota bacterium]
MNIWEDLKFRGLINQVTDEAGLEKLFQTEQVTMYTGFDPTADSLHVGHLLPILVLRRFQMAGHRPIALVGGATGMIGDPSGRSDERVLNTVETVHGYAKAICDQLARFLNFEGPNAAIMANNYTWLSEIDIITFLRDVGKNFNINYMLAKDSVSSRLANGLSFTEFTYMILQSYDFVELNKRFGCKLQVGGSDQWGNITSGLELLRKLEKDTEDTQPKAFGLTVPLVTKADGSKFGKSVGGAVWLDAEKTSPYEFYQFWLNVEDTKVVEYLKYFTFLSHAEILDLEKQTEENPGLRAGQKALAAQMTELVHGKAALLQAIKISEALFSGEVKNLTKKEIEQGFKDVPSYYADSKDYALIDLLVESKICPSKRQAREDITNGAIYLNGERITDLNYIVDEAVKIESCYTIIRRGKKKYTMIQYQ